MRIVIIGGGIGGLTTAVALQQHDFEAHVYEAAPEIRPVGKGIWLPTNAMLVLDRLSLGETVAAKGMALERIELHDRAAGLLQAIDLESIRSRYGRTTTSILRADLQAALVAALRPGTLYLGKRCQGIRQDDGGATVAFDDGTEVSAEVVVGADGIRSVVREAVVPAAPLRYAGQTCYLGVAGLALPTASLRIVREIWGGRERFGYSAVGPEAVYWFAPQTVPAGGVLPADSLRTLLDSYRDFPEPVPEIIDRTPADEIVRLDLHDLAPIDRWHRGRVVLIGDAAHAMTPNLGQGGAQAIEDAYALAQALHQSDSPEAAFHRYQQLRRSKARRIATTAWWLGRLAHMTSPWLRQVRNAGFKWAPQRLKQRQLEGLYKLNF